MESKVETKVCYVCGRLGTSFQRVPGSSMYRCDNPVCYSKVVNGVDRVFLSVAALPNGEITESFKAAFPRYRHLPFLGVDVAKKGQVTVLDPFVGVPDPVKKPEGVKSAVDWGSVAHMVELLKIGRYTEQELVEKTKLAASTVRGQLATKLRKTYELEVSDVGGRAAYRILNELT